MRRQRARASDSRSFWRAVAVMGRCWQARFTQDIGLGGAPLLLEERAEIGVGMEVARQRLHCGAPFVARVALVEGRHLGHQGLGSEKPDRLRPPLAVELYLTRSAGRGSRSP